MRERVTTTMVGQNHVTRLKAIEFLPCENGVAMCEIGQLIVDRLGDAADGNLLESLIEVQPAMPPMRPANRCIRSDAELEVRRGKPQYHPGGTAGGAVVHCPIRCVQR